MNEKYERRINIQKNTCNKSKIDRLYKYISLPSLADNNKKKINTFENKKMWFSKARELNDPFELLAVNNYYENKEELSKTKNIIEILSLSSDKENLLLWSHYAGVHKGCCLILEVINNDCIFKVDYRKERISIEKPINTTEQLEVYSVKSEDWKYESEYRVFNIDMRNDEKAIESENGIAIDTEDIGLNIIGLVIGAKTPNTVIDVLKKISYRNDWMLYMSKLSNIEYCLDYELL